MAVEMVLLQHGDIISAVIHRLGQLRNGPVRCSYAENIGNYTFWKVHVHHVKSRLDEMVSADNHRKYMDGLRQLEKVRSSLYRSPCYSCPMCRARKKPWPNDAGIGACVSQTGYSSVPPSYQSSESSSPQSRGDMRTTTRPTDTDRRTLSEWNGGGYRVKLGSRSVGRDQHTGMALFSRDQVYFSLNPRRAG